MPDVKQFKLPDVGEGLTEADILAWRVAVGDTVEVNQIIVEVETAKAAVELPSPFAGVVTALHCKDGDTVDVGRPIISIDVAPGATAGGSPEPAPPEDPPAVSPHADLIPSPPTVENEGRQPVLVGYGPRAEGATRRRRRGAVVTPSAQTAFNVPPESVVPESVVPESVVPDPVESTHGAVEPAVSTHRALAKPPVRKLAKTLGVDLATVSPTGPHGTVTRDDLQAAVDAPERAEVSGAGTARSPRSGQRETRVPVKGIRRHTAAAMVASAFTAPHVTEFVTFDMTATMELRERVAARREFRDVKISPLLFVAKAVILAAQRTPEINSTWDEAAGEIVLKHYVHLGIAAATDRGLVVPNIKDADSLSLLELAHALAELTATARAGRSTPADLTGGTITITNVGLFGIDTGTPILNPGETGIVAFGAVRRQPWVVDPGSADERIEPRWVTQLAVSFDHRVVDGQLGSQFLADVANVLTDPGLALL